MPGVQGSALIFALIRSQNSQNKVPAQSLASTRAYSLHQARSTTLADALEKERKDALSLLVHFLEISIPFITNDSQSDRAFHYLTHHTE